MNQLPSNGADFYATLKAKIKGRWQVIDSEKFRFAREPLIYSPTPSSVTEDTDLSISSAIFRWRSAVPMGDTDYRLMAGTLADPDAYVRHRIRPSGLDDCNADCDQFKTLTGLPINGSYIWVTLFWLDNEGEWRRESAQRYTAGSRRAIASPAPGTTLEGSAIKFSTEWNYFPWAESYRWRIGTSDMPSKYRSWPLVNSMNITGLPVDGSEVVVKYDIFDGRRWVNVDTAEYTAASALPYLWGDCTDTRSYGRRAIGFRAYPGTPEWEKYAPHTRGGFFNTNSRFGTHPRHAVLYRDGCASDKDYVLAGSPVFTPSIFVAEREKGVYLWLNKGSGAAQLSIVKRGEASTTTRMFALPPNDGNARPVFMPLPPNADGYFVFFYPIDQNKPVKLSEIRMTHQSDDVRSLPKLRFNTSYFDSPSRQVVALSGDPRARVTAEIAENFGPVAKDNWHGRAPNCAIFRWVDVTWMLDKGIHIHKEEYGATHTTVWINWELVTNAEIAAAIEHSVDSGFALEHNQAACTPAPKS